MPNYDTTIYVVYESDTICDDFESAESEVILVEYRYCSTFGG